MAKLPTEHRCLIGSRIRDARRLRSEGVERTTRLHNYQIEILIILATRELFQNGYNKEVREVVLALYEIQKKGFFSNDNS